MPEVTVAEALGMATQKLLAADLVQAVLRRQATNDCGRTTLRPVEIKAARFVQISTFDGRKTHVRNCSGPDLEAAVTELLSVPFRSLFVKSSSEETQVQFSRKGKPIVSVNRVEAPVSLDLSHDRSIPRALPEGEPDEFLQKIGMMTADGRIKAERRRKFQQINEFIRLVTETADLRQLSSEPLLIVDFGCGNAYLTFALHHYLDAKLGIECELIGVDRTAELIERDNALASALGSETIRFVPASIAEFQPPRNPDIVVALHACDTATDAALAQAIRHRAKLIFSAPCCHHNLQVQLEKGSPADEYLAIMRDGILKERLGDIVTDAARAMLLRIAGYRVDVIEFTSPEHTAKNLLIRAVRVPSTDTGRLRGEYEALKAAFGVAPYLETLLPADFVRAP